MEKRTRTGSRTFGKPHTTDIGMSFENSTGQSGRAWDKISRKPTAKQNKRKEFRFPSGHPAWRPFAGWQLGQLPNFALPRREEKTRVNARAL